MSPERSADLERIAEAVSDGTPIDWEGEMAARPDLSEALLNLSLLERVREVHAAIEPSDTSATETEEVSTVTTITPEKGPTPLFLWGSFRVMERVGETAGSEVFRAFDPTLQTEFALKLRKRDAARVRGTAMRSLSEARRLARVRHPNVLVVHGADEHDGRMGLWTDFVRGKSLEEYFRHEGLLSAREATLIGLDLCRALAAVHAARLVHRDVKTGNVMREEGGRIVLMDFGCVAEMPTQGVGLTGGRVEGTAITMAPEQLRGVIAGPATDLYALGVLLYRIVSGRYPIEAKSLEELAEKQRRGERVPLRDHRADLPLDFVQVVERALSYDPKQRYTSAGEMERALANLLAGHVGQGGGQARPSQQIPPWALAAAAGVIVSVAALLVWLNRPETLGGLRHAAAPPAVTGPAHTQAALTATATLFRRSGSKLEPLPASGGRIRPGDQLSMDFRGNEPIHTYVLNEDIVGKVYVLFPIPGVSPTNPLAASVPYQLPGRMGDSLVFWTVTSAGGREEIAAIASREPLEELERVIAQIPRAAPGRPVQYRELSARDLDNLRGIGGLKKEAAIPEDAHRRLDATIQSLSERAKKVGDVWVWTISLENPSQAP
jgi:eukaryotic-like serine/threonine-protein kinase